MSEAGPQPSARPSSPAAEGTSPGAPDAAGIPTSSAVAELARGLVRAEDRLRAQGLTGARAFAALRDALQARLGDPVEPTPEARELVAGLPLDGPVDLLGLAYERFFADLFKGRRGQYFTPRPIVELLLERAEVGPGQRVLDPTCGSGGFLVCAARRGAAVRGVELDPLLADLARLNLRLGGFDGEVRQADFLTLEPDPVDVVVANPPFSVPVRDRAVLDRFALGRGRRQVASDWLFVEALERWVVPGGRAALVLPWSVVVNPSLQPVRARIDAAWHREAVCTLPEGVFRPFGGAAGRAVLLWLRRGRGRGVTRWADLADPGYDVRSIHYRATEGADLRALRHPDRWRALPPGAWTPDASPPEVGRGRGVRRLGTLATLRTERAHPEREPEATFGLVDLADADKATGEVTSIRRLPGAAIAGSRPVLVPGDVLVSRLRPTLGNVAVAPRPPDLPWLVGSPEWLVLRAELPHFVLHALRTPAWRDGLPVTGGQTRPRTNGPAVLDSAVPWPGDALAGRIDALSRCLHEERAALRARLDGLQHAVDRWAAGELDDAGLAAAIDALER